jgi:hypothetical protein
LGAALEAAVGVMGQKSRWFLTNPALSALQFHEFAQSSGMTSMLR